MTKKYEVHRWGLVPYVYLYNKKGEVVAEIDINSVINYYVENRLNGMEDKEIIETVEFDKKKQGEYKMTGGE